MEKRRPRGRRAKALALPECHPSYAERESESAWRPSQRHCRASRSAVPNCRQAASAAWGDAAVEVSPRAEATGMQHVQWQMCNDEGASAQDTLHPPSGRQRHAPCEGFQQQACHAGNVVERSGRQGSRKNCSGFYIW